METSVAPQVSSVVHFVGDGREALACDVDEAQVREALTGRSVDPAALQRKRLALLDAWIDQAERDMADCAGENKSMWEERFRKLRTQREIVGACAKD